MSVGYNIYIQGKHKCYMQFGFRLIQSIWFCFMKWFAISIPPEQRVNSVEHFSQTLKTGSQLAGRLDNRLDLPQKQHRLTSIDNAVVVCEGHVHHRTNLDLQLT